MIELKEWNACDVDSFVEKELEYFFFLLWIFSMKTFEDKEVKLNEEEGNWLDVVFKEYGESLCNIDSGGGSFFEWLSKSKEKNV